MRIVRGGLLVLIAIALAGAVGVREGPGTSGDRPHPAREVAVDHAKFADGDDNWPAYGRTWNANHFSPLSQINEGNVAGLKLAWYTDIDDHGSLYTSPIEVNGTIYVDVGLGKIHAFDALTGKLLWKYDPEVGNVAGMKLRWGWGSRGISYWDGKVYSATLDGRLIAIDAKSGAVVWSVQTTEGPDDGRYITGAPWLFDGKVIIGHGGADFSTVRGYVTAYDASTGKKLWRFYTVPGDPAKGFEDSAQAMAAKTWTGQWWKYGGGGTAWNAMAYDPKFNRIYIGVGNGDPWNQKIRSPGGGDNLFLSSIVALDADTGKYVWHYQNDPGETWDYNSTMDIELTDMVVGGKLRPVLMQAPKDGFFHVIDRATGKLLSAEKFSAVTWASHIDMKTGRPVETPGARYPQGSVFLLPGSAGGHNAQPMSYSPVTGLVYIPAQDFGTFYTEQGIDLKTWKPVQGRGYNTAVKMGYPPAGSLPPRAYLLAWDPLHQRKVWSNPLPPAWGGGVTSTGGNLVMNGDANGQFTIYSARDGKTLWRFDAQTGISSQPISYAVNGRQYITIISGYRGIIGASPWDFYSMKRRVLTFALDGKATLPPYKPETMPFLDNAAFKIDDAKAKRGSEVAADYNCSNCHGTNLAAGGMAPDLRRSAVPQSLEALTQVLHEGILQSEGMPRFQELTPAQIEALQHYILATARAAAKGAHPPYPLPEQHQ